MNPAQALRLPAPAKLNLFLHVTGRRADGYHELETVFVFLEYGDELRLEPRDDGEIVRLRGPRGLPAGADLCVRAARELKARCGVKAGVSIELDKRLPMGGGVGGGSSDAASVLLGLNHLWQCDLDEDALADLGLGLGADVPVFVRGRAAFAAGVGERLSPVDLPARWFLVLCPPVEVATARVFADSSLTRNAKPLKIRGFPWKTDPDAAFDAMWRETRNDCEPVVCAAEPVIRQVRDWLGQHAPARMTGTGACVFAVLPSEEEAQELERRASRELIGRGACAGVMAFVAPGSNGSPVLRALSAAGSQMNEWGVAKR